MARGGGAQMLHSHEWQAACLYREQAQWRDGQWQLKPIDFVKTRLQLPNSPYNSLFGGMAQIIREEGFTTLYTGLSSELIKSSLQSFLYFYWYYIFKEVAATAIARWDTRRLNSDKEATAVAPSFSRNAMLASASAVELKLHQERCADPSCFCRSVTHALLHGEAHKARAQLELWREKALQYRRTKLQQSLKKKERARQLQQQAQSAHDPLAFDANVFHPRLFPSVSEPSLAGLLAAPKHDIDDSPYVDVKSADQTALVTNTATLLVPPTVAEEASKAADPTATIAAVSTPSPPLPSPSPPPLPQLSIGTTLLLGTLAGCVTQLVVNPVSVVQTRMMTQKRHGGAGHGFFAITADIFRNEGAAAFFAGILPSFILSTNPSIQFLVFDRLKALILRVLSQSLLAPRSLSMLESFVLGAFSKIVATLVTYPYIMAKIRLQYKGDAAAAAKPIVYKGTLDVLLRTIKYEGIRGLYAGLSAQLLKSVLGTALMFMAKEKLADVAVLIAVWWQRVRQNQLQQTSGASSTTTPSLPAAPASAESLKEQQPKKPQ